MKSNVAVMLVHILPSMVRWPEVISASVVVFVLAMLWLGHKARKRQARWIQARLQELEAYCRLETNLRRGGKPGEFEEQAKLVCRLVRARSVYSRVALLLLDTETQMPCAGSCGVDEVALDALHALGIRLLHEESTGDGKAPASFGVMLDDWEDASGVALGGVEMTIVPLRLRSGRLTGLLAVGAEARMQRRINLAEQTKELPRAAMPVEMLAARLGSRLERRRFGEQEAQTTPQNPAQGSSDKQVDPLAVLLEAT